MDCDYGIVLKNCTDSIKPISSIKNRIQQKVIKLSSRVKAMESKFVKRGGRLAPFGLTFLEYRYLEVLRRPRLSLPVTKTAQKVDEQQACYG